MQSANGSVSRTASPLYALRFTLNGSLPMRMAAACDAASGGLADWVHGVLPATGALGKALDVVRGEILRCDRIAVAEVSGERELILCAVDLAEIGKARSLPGERARVEELRHRDRDEDANDENDDQGFEKGKAAAGVASMHAKLRLHNSCQSRPNTSTPQNLNTSTPSPRKPRRRLHHMGLALVVARVVRKPRESARPVDHGPERTDDLLLAHRVGR